MLLGAGLDDRAWRLQLVRPGAVFFELDTPMLLSVKAQALRDAFPAQHKRVPVAADLRRPLDAISALATAGWDRSEPTAWVLEGVIQWLPHDHLPLLLHTLFHHSAPLSKLVATLERCDAARLQQMWHAMQLPPVAPPEPVALTAETLMARVADAGFNAVLVMARELGLEYDIDLEEALCCVLGNKPSEAANLAPAAPGPPT